MMPRPTRTEAVKRFLESHTREDLAARYHYGMEVQVNVAEDGGTRIEGSYMGRQWRGFTGPEGQVWKPFRIPYKANTTPEYTDVPMSFDLAIHCESIGMTGWNWVNKKSEWWGFDFDGIKGHAEAHTRKLTEEQLHEVQLNTQSIPWVTVRRSTSGKGLHLYVYCTGFPTANHTEHIAVGRALLSYMSACVGYDFRMKVDSTACVMWVWHRKMVGTDGLTLLKQGCEIPIEEIPANWRDHIDVVSGKRRRNLPQFIVEQQPVFNDAERIFEEISGQRATVPLDDEHKELIEWFRNNNCQWWWDNDRHMLVTHTYHLKEAHEALSLKGVFDTIAIGSQRGADHNCYCFPMRAGAWVVRRYSPGCTEATTWDQDQSGFTRCFYNRKPDLKTAARACEGVEQLNGSFVFASGDQAQKAAGLLGADLKIPIQVITRPVELRQREDRLGVDIQAFPQTDNAQQMNGWANKSGKWRKVVQVQTPPPESGGTLNCDDIVRHLVNKGNEDAGWIIQSDSTWRVEPLKHVTLGLKAIGFLGKETELIEGTAVAKPWVIVNLPFQPEYPGDRSWNRNAAQFKIAPAEELDANGCTHWNKILNHLGNGLDESIQEDGWCKSNGILTGADYLKVWIASLVQHPLEPLPYLFFYSPEENTGKSTFHEALSLLFTGVEFADNALTNPQGFNGELVNAVVCVVEETTLQGNKVALSRIRAWVTNRQFPVHAKRGTPYSIPNSTHWMQFSNDPRSCPIFSGDTRITMITVQPFQPSEIIPKRLFFERLSKEASYFLAELINLEIPRSNDRLNLPVIDTQEKQSIQATNETLLETFLRECVHHVPGEIITVADMWNRFYGWMDENDRDKYTKITMGKEMPGRYPKGRPPGSNTWSYGNCSFEPRSLQNQTLQMFMLKGEKLIPIKSKAETA